MTMNVVWDDPHCKTLRVDCGAAWSWLALRKALRVGFAMMRNMGHRVDLIFDLTETTQIPAEPVLNFAFLQAYFPAHLGTIVFISDDEQFLASLETVYYVYREGGQKALSVHTLAQARALLAHERHMLISGQRN